MHYTDSSIVCALLPPITCDEASQEVSWWCFSALHQDSEV